MSPVGDACRWVLGTAAASWVEVAVRLTDRTEPEVSLKTVLTSATPVPAYGACGPVTCRERLRANPSLVNCCTIDWLGPPPADALEAVAQKQLSELADMNADTRKTLVGLCQAIHVQVRTSTSRPRP